MLNELICYDKEQIIYPDHPMLRYCGRIDSSNPQAPRFIYAGSQIQFRFYGTSLKLALRNHHSHYVNQLGYSIDGKEPDKILLQDHSELAIYTLAENLALQEHEVIIYKRQDAAHYFDFHGLVLESSAMLKPLPPSPTRRMECFGDSVSAGEVCEAVDYVGQIDPEHNGEYSNSWYSYAAITARNLNADLHNNSQGGIALLDGTGYFNSPNYLGVESTYDKLSYYPYLSEMTPWDFSLYTPHVVLVAIGQNDSHPEDYMGKDPVKSRRWENAYRQLLVNLRDKYPNALIVCKTTILYHYKDWDDAIESVIQDLNDPKIVHFMYSNNGSGTPGHIRISEAQAMAEELTAFLNGFGEQIWLS